MDIKQYIYCIMSWTKWKQKLQVYNVLFHATLIVNIIFKL
jgi:hypothetical protein